MVERMICPNCGVPNPEGGNFCINCGKRLTSGKCPKCGTLNPPGGIFCISCGSRIRSKPLHPKFGFLSNARDGKNNLWRYIATIILTLGVSSVIVGFIMGMILSIIFVFGYGGFEVFNILFNPLLLLIMMTLIFSTAYLFLYFSIRVLHGRSFKSLINWGRDVDWNRILKGAAVWILVMGLMDILTFILNPGSFRFFFFPDKFFISCLISIFAFPIQASFEEVFFRGYLLQGLSLLFKKPIIALIINSLIFATLHWWNGANFSMSVSIVLSAFIIGMMLGIIAIADNGIELAMGIHIINNLYVAVIHNSPDSGIGNLPSLIVSQPTPILSPILLLAAAFITIFILFKNRKEDILPILK